MSSIRADECVGLRNVAGHRRPDHHVRAEFEARSRSVKTAATPFGGGLLIFLLSFLEKEV